MTGPALTFDESVVREAVRALNDAKRSTNVSQLSSRTQLSRQRVLAAAQRLQQLGLIRDVGRGSAYNFRIVDAVPAVSCPRCGELCDDDLDLEAHALDCSSPEPLPVNRRDDGRWGAAASLRYCTTCGCALSAHTHLCSRGDECPSCPTNAERRSRDGF